MTRTQSARAELLPFEPVEALAGASALAGKRTVKTEPLPGSLVTVTSPPIMRASLRVIAKSEAGAAVLPGGRGIGLAEFLEQLRLLLRRHADAGVGHGDLDPIVPVDHPPDPQRHLALLGELAGIAQKIEQDLPQPHGVDGQLPEIFWGFEDETVLVLLRQLPRRADDVLEQAGPNSPSPG